MLVQETKSGSSPFSKAKAATIQKRVHIPSCSIGSNGRTLPRHSSSSGKLRIKFNIQTQLLLKQYVARYLLQSQLLYTDLQCKYFNLCLGKANFADDLGPKLNFIFYSRVQLVLSLYIQQRCLTSDIRTQPSTLFPYSTQGGVKDTRNRSSKAATATQSSTRYILTLFLATHCNQKRVLFSGSHISGCFQGSSRKCMRFSIG